MGDYGKNSPRKFIKKIRQEKRGYALILVACFIPVIFAGITYLNNKIKEYHESNLGKGAVHSVGMAVLEKFDPSKTLAEQKKKVYSAGAQALNDRGFSVLKKAIFPAPTTVPVYYTSVTIKGDI
ncbi:MAG: hypothetical protein LBS23_02090, partial [Holosporaceae bacterium]|nr:hypothetical protein [Holosporaceae bacterium]